MSEWDNTDWGTEAEPPDTGWEDTGISETEITDPALLPETELTDPALLPETSVDPGTEFVGQGHLADLWWQEQSEDGLCVPTSVAMIASQLSGRWITEAEVVSVACNTDPPLLDGEPGAWSGMTAEEGELLLEELGIEAETLDGGTVEDLERYVNQQGRGVILAVDSDEIWYGLDDDSSTADAMADHALRLAHIDNERGVAILEDPGSSTGQGYEITLAQLEDAWEDSGSQYVVTGDLATDAAATGVTPDAEPVPEAEPVADPAPGTGIDLEPTSEPVEGDDHAVERVGAAAAGAGFVLVPLIVKEAREKIQARQASA